MLKHSSRTPPLPLLVYNFESPFVLRRLWLSLHNVGDRLGLPGEVGGCIAFRPGGRVRLSLAHKFSGEPTAI